MKASVVRRAVIDYARRHGAIVTAAEARTCGATSRQLAALVRDGVLHRRHPGVYVLTSARREHRIDVMAALRALQARGREHRFVASHASAAWLQGLTDRPPESVHLTAGARYGRRLSGVVVHRTTSPTKPLARRIFQGIACTPPARTLVDMAATATPAQVADAVDLALANRLVRVSDLVAETRSNPGRRGSDQLRRCLAQHGYTGVPAPSVLESRMARLMTGCGLPLATPQCIAGPAGEYRLDYAYRTPGQPRLMVELYGYTWHHSPGQMAGDLARQRRLTLEGWTVLIFTWQDVTMQPERVAREIQGALDARPERFIPETLKS